MQLVNPYPINNPFLGTTNAHLIKVENTQKHSQKAEKMDAIKKLEASLSAAKNVQQRLESLNSLALAILNFDQRRALELGKEARDIAFNHGDSKQLATSLVIIGLAELELNHTQKAAILLSEAHSRFEQLGNTVGKARALIGLGRLETSKGENNKAIEMTEKAIKLLEPYNYPLDEVNALTSLAQVYSDLGNHFPEALKYNLQALEKAKKHDLIERQVMICAKIGDQYQKIGDYERSRSYLQKGLRIAESNTCPYRNLQKPHAFILSSLSNVFLAMEEYQTALQYALRSMELESPQQPRTLRTHSQNNLGELYLHLHDLDAAFDHFQQAMLLSKAIQFPLGEARGYLGMGKVRLAQSDLQEASQHLQQAMKTARSGSYQEIQYKTHKALAKLHRENNEFEKALVHQEQYQIIKEVVFNAQSDLRLKTLEVIHGVETVRKEAKHQKEQNTLLQQEVQERKRAETAARKRAEEMEALRDTITDITSELDLSKLLQKITERVMGLLHAEAGELALYDKEKQELETLVSNNQSQDFTGFRKSLGNGGMGYAAKLRRTLIVDDYKSWEHRDSSFEAQKPLSVLFCPLIQGQRLLGVIAVATDRMKSNFSKEDTHLLEMFAQQAAIAIHNAQLFEKVKDLADTDELTHTKNRRSLVKIVLDEFNRAKRYHHPLSMIMLDIDHFKTINDTYGHKIGDQILKAVSKVCKNATRDVDTLGRYSGKEFILLQPETCLKEALITAQRIQKEAEQIIIESNKGNINITASIGVTELTDSVKSPEMLFDEVDQAMYRAKQAGRNCVSL